MAITQLMDVQFALIGDGVSAVYEIDLSQVLPIARFHNVFPGAFDSFTTSARAPLSVVGALATPQNGGSGNISATGTISGSVVTLSFASPLAATTFSGSVDPYYQVDLWLSY